MQVLDWNYSKEMDIVTCGVTTNSSLLGSISETRQSHFWNYALLNTHNGFKRPTAGPRYKSVPHGTLCTHRLRSRLDSIYKTSLVSYKKQNKNALLFC